MELVITVIFAAMIGVLSLAGLLYVLVQILEILSILLTGKKLDEWKACL